MVCIYCSGSTQVINSRLQKKLNQVWRRRRCQSCNAVFTTHEAADLNAALLVASGKQLRPFVRDKLYLSIYSSLKHRKTAINDAGPLADTVISNITSLAQQSTIERSLIISSVTAVLTNFDTAAATHYQAFHQADNLTK